MKIINAYIQKFMCEKVTDALRETHVHGMTILECSGVGCQSEEDSDHYLDKTVCVGFSPKIKLEILCNDKDVDMIISTIQKAAHTGKYGDGKIYVISVDDAVRIRTGERGDDAV